VNLYKQIKENISLAADFHVTLGRFYECLTDKVARDRGVMLLDYQSRQENRLKEGL
jgi:hypothetical protein